jgi:hypothetical protein
MKYYVKTIKDKSEIDSVPKAYIDKYVWGDQYTPVSYAQLGLIKEEGLFVKLTSFEKNPKVTGTEYGHKVHLDSCLEFFVSMDNTSPIYVNFEANSAGAFVLTARLNRHDDVRHAHTIEGLKLPEVKAEVKDDHWSVSVLFDYELIEKLFGKKITFEKGYVFKGNFYKCGDETEIEHYGMWSPITLVDPDFHRSDFFADIEVE